MKVFQKITKFESTVEDKILKSKILIEGKVNSRIMEEGIVIFNEIGNWKNKNKINVRNKYKWKFSDKKIILFNLRNGDSETKLITFYRKNKNKWDQENSHICYEDVYSAVLQIFENRIILSWKIKGPKKHQSIKIIYS